MRERALAAAALAALAAGGLLRLADAGGAADAVWAAGIALMLVPLTWSVARSLLRRDVGVDAIALVAMAGALALGEYLAGAVVALMLAGGNALEASAGRRARRELRALLERAPRTARRVVDGGVEVVAIEAIVPGDTVAVRAGEVLPVDGVVTSGAAVVDESALTGEPLPVTYHPGEPVRSGTANAGEAFELRATRPAAESAYAAIVRLVREAEGHQARFVRIADRYAAVFLPLTLAVAGAAWAASGDPVRALAVLVVATPCPLILAAPIAFVSGVSRAARQGVVVKGGAAIERLGAARTVLLDKTGTLTLALPDVERVTALDGIPEDEVLRLAASVDQLSTHVVGEALVAAAGRRGLDLAVPADVAEEPGEGIEGTVDGRHVAVGGRRFVRARGVPVPDEHATAFVSVDGRLAGTLVLADRLRPDAAALVAQLREAGIRHVAIASGDREAPAQAIGRAIGADRVYAEQTPEDKLELVRSLQARPDLRPVVMVGDGVNDAPALALADVGIAVGTTGTTVAAESADAVIAVDRVDRVAAAVRIGRRSLAIARQSVLVGIGLSLAAMGFAAFGYLAPVAGAVLQEGIDVAVILNALRALRG